MYVVYGQISIFLPYTSNLKEKRKIVLSIVDRIRKRFNISIAEVDDHELWQRCSLGFSAVTGNHSEIDVMVGAVYTTVERHINDVEILSFNYDIIRPSDH
ncbi:ylxp-like protein [hydrocarbon metagenome]|uniref:Ylxp-like protein n=1 Tax=hydrocarbon metagenome TaxID=938273 RepID=A0A0W8E7E3_9ZZZZ